MSTFTIELEEDILERSTEYAQKHGTTLGALVRNLLVERVEEKEPESAFGRAVARACQAGLRSNGDYLTREEIYNRG